MATWHQQRGGGLSGLYTPDPAQWKVIENAPNTCCAVSRVGSSLAAQLLKEGLEKHHPHLRGHVRIVQPAPAKG